MPYFYFVYCMNVWVAVFVYSIILLPLGQVAFAKQILDLNRLLPGQTLRGTTTAAFKEVSGMCTATTTTTNSVRFFSSMSHLSSWTERFCGEDLFFLYFDATVFFEKCSRIPKPLIKVKLTNMRFRGTLWPKSLCQKLSKRGWRPNHTVVASNRFHAWGIHTLL